MTLSIPSILVKVYIIDSIILFSSFLFTSNNSLEKLIVRVLSSNLTSNTLVPEGIILLKPLGIILDFLPSTISPSTKSLALSTASQLQLAILVLAT